MGFWILLLFCNIIIPVIMIIFGKIFSNKSPKEINHFYGYRTSMAMKNKNTWDFAHKYFGKIWFSIGIIILPLSIFAFIFCVNNNVDNIEIYSLIIIGIQTIVMIFPILSTEKALRKMFDNNGNYK